MLVSEFYIDIVSYPLIRLPAIPRQVFYLHYFYACCVAIKKGYNSGFTYIKNNIDEIQNDLTLMFAGEKISSGIQEYAATAQVLETKEEIYSAMVVYGLLTYENGKVFIPNKEVMEVILQKRK